MPNTTFPHQKRVCVHREIAKTDFLGIKNENWQAAARDLRPHALLLYLYLASNADNYTLALSPVAVQEAIGMPRSTYNDQVQNLINKGYLVLSHGNTFDFYEVPQPRTAIKTNDASLGLCIDNNCTASVNQTANAAKTCPPENREINNSENSINNKDKNIDFSARIEQPKVKEIVIPTPKAEGKKRPKALEEFVF